MCALLGTHRGHEIEELSAALKRTSVGVDTCIASLSERSEEVQKLCRQVDSTVYGLSSRVNDTADRKRVESIVDLLLTVLHLLLSPSYVSSTSCFAG